MPRSLGHMREVHGNVVTLFVTVTAALCALLLVLGVYWSVKSFIRRRRRREERRLARKGKSTRRRQR